MVPSKATADMEQPSQDTFFRAIDGVNTWVGSSQAQSKPLHQPLWYVRQRRSFVWSSKMQVGSQERAGSSSTASAGTARPPAALCSSTAPGSAQRRAPRQGSPRRTPGWLQRYLHKASVQENQVRPSERTHKVISTCDHQGTSYIFFILSGQLTQLLKLLKLLNVQLTVFENIKK